MKNKLLILGLIALMLAGGLALAGCKEGDCSGSCGREGSACTTNCDGSSNRNRITYSCEAPDVCVSKK